ncbi:MAG: hypothetical protein ACP5JH_01925 [Bacteroidota bacterium]
MKKVEISVLMSEIFIINEWLWSDSNGDNGIQKQKEAFSFLETLCKRCDRIAVAKGSRFQRKALDFSRNAGESADVIKRGIARLYFHKIIFNSLKYEEVDIEGNEVVLEGINPDDAYLVKTHYKTKAPIITTDNKLMTFLQPKNIPCKLRDAFLKEYL